MPWGASEHLASPNLGPVPRRPGQRPARAAAALGARRVAGTAVLHQAAVFQQPPRTPPRQRRGATAAAPGATIHNGAGYPSHNRLNPATHNRAKFAAHRHAGSDSRGGSDPTSGVKPLSNPTGRAARGRYIEPVSVVGTARPKVETGARFPGLPGLPAGRIIHDDRQGVGACCWVWYQLSLSP
jgi:hypothetical protein